MSLRAPAVLALLVAALGEEMQQVAAAALGTLDWLPYALLATAALLGWYFRKSRVVFWAGAFAAGLAFLKVPLVAVLLPLTLAVLSRLEDRSVPGTHNLLEVAWLLSQVALGCWLLEPAQTWLLQQLDTTTAWAVAGAGLMLLTLRKVKVWTPLETGLLQAYFLACAGLLAFSGVEARLLFALAAAALIGSVVRLSYGMAYLDELTELPGRRALTEELKELGSRYTIAMLDVDHFKKFNDTHGHDVGDQVLRMVAFKIRDVGGGGRPFRYGGEEFTVLFPGKEPQDALEHLDALRELIARSPLVLRSADRPKKRPSRPLPQKGPRASVSVTVSIGVAGPGEGTAGPWNVIKAADKALYRAKKKGRNRVCT